MMMLSEQTAVAVQKYNMYRYTRRIAKQNWKRKNNSIENQEELSAEQKSRREEKRKKQLVQ